MESTYQFMYLAYLDTSYRILWKYSKMGHFPTWNITCFKCFGVFQHLLCIITVTNETFCGKYISIYVLSIFGQILVDVMEIFQDGAFPNLKYHLFQVSWCISAFTR